MNIPQRSSRVVPFKLAAALDAYEVHLRALAETWFDPDLLRRVRQDFGQVRLLGAAVPKLSVSCIAVLVSHARLLQALRNRTGSAMVSLHEHLGAVDHLRKRCLRMIGAQAVVLA
jgi:hypothetical protein